MQIGIDASRAFLARRTGIEEYSYRLISHLRGPLRDERVVLYVRDGQEPDFALPVSWSVRTLRAPRLWTQGRLSIEMLLHRPDVLIVPAHTVPIIHPKRTIVVVHGLEYECSPESYSAWERFSMRLIIRFSVRVAERVVAVSENTKRDLMRLYRVPGEKITVVYEGRPDKNQELGIRNKEAGRGHGESERPMSRDFLPTTRNVLWEGGQAFVGNPYILFVGRIEKRKNVRRIVEAFDILKRDHNIPHRLVLIGRPGYGYTEAEEAIRASDFRSDIVETGYVSEAEKSALLRDADVFVFPSLYEGFGLPVVEAQAAGVPVVTSRTSSLPEVALDGAVLVDPLDPASIATGIMRIVSDDGFRDAILQRGRKNVERFDWDSCAAAVADLSKDRNG